MNSEYIIKIQNDLKNLSEKSYKEFSAKLIPTVDPDTVLGIRLPILRNYATQLFKKGDYDVFLRTLPHEYFDENHLHSFLICKIKDFDLCVNELEKFLPYVDNWSVCDSLRPVCFSKNKDRLIEKIYEWIYSDHPYTVRFAIEMLMTHFLDDDFKREYLDLVSGVISDEYYVNMMISWYFATALAKKYKETISIIEEKTLSVRVHNKTIQKAIESYRISDEAKNYLKTLKI